MKAKIAAWCSLLILLPGISNAQVQTAVPFLTLTISVEGNGMGGISASLISGDAISAISNPAQLGLFGQDNLFSASTYTPKTMWLPSFGGDLSLDASAVTAGLRLDRYMKLPAAISIGIGYLHVYFDLGTFNQTLINNPTVIYTWYAFEKADMLAFGIEINYFVKFGLGYSYKWIDSQLAPFGAGQANASGATKAPAHDFGTLLQIPVVNIVSRLRHKPLAGC